MTLELFSSLLEEFISKNDTLSVTGLGVFKARIQAASISDNGFTINPPYRKLEFFAEQATEDGASFEKLFAAKYKIGIEEAKMQTEEISSLILNSLREDKVLELPNFGKFRSLENGEVFFIMDMEADIYPEGFGLESVSLKNKSVKALPQKSSEARLLFNIEEEEKEELAEKKTEQKEGEKKEEKKKKEGGKVFWRLLWARLIIATVLLCAFLLLSRFYPELLDKILYSPEELEIIKSLGI